MKKKLVSLCTVVLLLIFAMPPAVLASAPAYAYLENVALGAAVIGTPGEGTAANLTGGTYYPTGAHAAGMGIDLVLDFAEAKTLSRISVYTRNVAASGDGIIITASETGEAYDAVGTTADSTTKTVVGTDGYNASIVRHDFSLSGNYRYVKLYRDSASSWVHISGFAAYALNENAAAVPADGNLAAGKSITGEGVDATYGDVTKLVDGDNLTLTNFNTAASTVLLDLGGSYPIDGVRLCGRVDNASYSSGNSVSVALAPTAYFDADETATLASGYSFKAGDNSFSTTDKTKTYRYLRLTGAWMVPAEVEVYIARDAVTGDGQGNLAYNKPVFAAGGMQKSQVSSLNSATGTNYCEFYRSIDSDAIYGYAQIDLQNTYDLGKVVVSFRNSTQASERTGWQVLASTDFAFTSPKDLGTLTAASANGEDWVIDVTDENANYRYIRLVKADAQYGLVREVAVYAKGNTKKAAISAVDIKDTPGTNPNGGAYTLERFESVTLAPGYELADSVLFAVTYDASGKRIGFKRVELSEIANADAVFGDQNVTLTFDWAVACPPEGGSVRVFIWDGLGNLKPITPSLTGTVSPAVSS